MLCLYVLRKAKIGKNIIDNGKWQQREGKKHVFML